VGSLNNTASAIHLTAIKGIGPSRAKAIVRYRAKNGAFTSVDELSRVPHIDDMPPEELEQKGPVRAHPDATGQLQQRGDCNELEQLDLLGSHERRAHLAAALPGRDDWTLRGCRGGFFLVGVRSDGLGI
jgi:competence protein ComEA